MKKFKIKNRPKRKYVRKVVEPSGTLFSKALPIGLLPMVLIVIAVIMNAFISTKPVDNFVGSLSFPTITLPTLPSIALPHISITLPNLPIMDAIASFFQSIANLFASLNPSPALQETGKGIANTNDYIGSSLLQGFASIGKFVQISAMQVITLIGLGLQTFWHGIIMLGIFIGTSIAQGFIALITGIQIVGESFLNLLTMVGNGIVYGAVTVVHFIVVAALWLFQGTIYVLQVTIAGIVSFLQAVWHAINAFIDGLLWAIAWPFKTVWGYMLQTKPFFVAFGALIKQSANELMNGFTTLGSTIHEISKATSK
jgi:hypothetical protein